MAHSTSPSAEQQDPREVARRLREILGRRFPDQSIRSIAGTAGVDYSTLAKVLRGELLPSQRMVEALADAVGIPADALATALRGDYREYTRLFPPDEDLFDFGRVTGFCPAWEWARSELASGFADRAFRERFADNTAAFLVLAGQLDPLAAAIFRQYLLQQDLDAVLRDLEDKAAPVMRRVVFHALAFTKYPIEYARTGALFIDKKITDLAASVPVPDVVRHHAERFATSQPQEPNPGGGRTA